MSSHNEIKYAQNLYDWYKFCASRGVLPGME